MKRSVYTREKAHRAREMRGSTFRAERKLWDYLRVTPIGGHSFERQHRVGPYVLDFYCAAAKLAIELDASQHAAESGVSRDTARTRYLNKKRIQVIRFDNQDLTNNFAGVCDSIGRALTDSTTDLPLSRAG